MGYLAYTWHYVMAQGSFKPRAFVPSQPPSQPPSGLPDDYKRASLSFLPLPSLFSSSSLPLCAFSHLRASSRTHLSLTGASTIRLLSLFLRAHHLDSNVWQPG